MAARTNPEVAGQQPALGACLGDRGRGGARLGCDTASRMGRAADRRAGHPRHLCLADLDARLRTRRPGAVQDGSEGGRSRRWRSEEHTSELQSLMRISYAVFCLKKKKKKK